MKIQTALRNLKSQKDFLGVSWEKLFSLLRETASEFPDIIIESFDTYRDHVEDRTDNDQ